MEGPAGGSLYVRDFALELARQGHEPVVYCRRLGHPAEELRSKGILVLDSIERLARPDIIHGNSPIETVAAMLQFSDTPAIFVCHGWGPDAIAPRIHGIMRYLAVSEHARDALLSCYGVPPELVLMHQNPVDLGRFPRRGPLPAVPQKALVFSNTLTECDFLPVIRAACSEMGISLDAIGSGVGRISPHPERILLNYDVVFAKGRAALEAMATGCAVILADLSGFGELVTTENYDLLRLKNFGLRALRLPATKETIRTQLRRYDPAEAASVTERVRAREGLTFATQALVEIYHAAIEEHRRTPPASWHRLRTEVARFLDQIAPTSNTFYVAEHVEPWRRRAAQAEIRLRRLAETLGLQPLAHDVLSSIALRALHWERVVSAGETFQALVELENRSGVVLASLGDYPLRLSYHWLDPENKMRNEPRLSTEIDPPLPPGRTFRYSVRVKAPSSTGKYTLRLTALQEHICWLDTLGVYADVPCEVLGSQATCPAQS